MLSQGTLLHCIYTMHGHKCSRVLLFLAEDIESAKRLMQDCNANSTADNSFSISAFVSNTAAPPAVTTTDLFFVLGEVYR